MCRAGALKGGLGLPLLAAALWCVGIALLAVHYSSGAPSALLARQSLSYSDGRGLSWTEREAVRKSKVRHTT